MRRGDLVTVFVTTPLKPHHTTYPHNPTKPLRDGASSWWCSTQSLFAWRPVDRLVMELKISRARGRSRFSSMFQACRICPMEKTSGSLRVGLHELSTGLNGQPVERQRHRHRGDRDSGRPEAPGRK